jgi:hypothetical protein
MKALKKLHEAAAEHYEKAAEHHRNAAEYASDGDHVEAAHQAHIAHGHALHGHEQAALATKKHIELNAEHEHNEAEADEEEAA